MLKVQNRVLSIQEIRQVVKYHKTGGRRLNSPAVQLRFAVFRLSCCAGLRVSEIVGLNLSDFYFDGPRPYIRIRKEITKGHRRPGSDVTVRRGRTVDIAYEPGTVEDLKRWYQFRLMQAQGKMDAPFICGQTAKNVGQRLDRTQVARLWHTALRCLGGERRGRSVHVGRHSCLSHLVWSGFPLTYVRDFAGHANIATTSIYSHACNPENLPASPLADAVAAEL